MPTLPQQPQEPADKSLQINVNSEDDAKAVIQHLPHIKRTWDMLSDTAGVTSIEFCIAETIRRKVDATLIGAIRWCRTYVKSVKPFDGNIHFPLPHFVPPSVTMTRSEASNKPVEVEAPKKGNRYLNNVSPEEQAAAAARLASDQEPVVPQVSAEPLPIATTIPGKSTRPVRAEQPGT